jgi:hypothetical protein
MGIKDVVRWEGYSGPRTAVGDNTVTPHWRSLTVRLPFGGFVWSRATAVMVERDGRTERVPIPDVTRRIQLAMIGVVLIGVLVSRALSRNKGEGER